MARPWRGTTGSYYLRQRTPTDLLKRLRGQRVTVAMGDAGAASVKIGPTIQVSLRTKEAAVARKRHTAAQASLAAYWEAQRKGPAKLSKKEIVALAGEAYRAFADTFGNNPGDPTIWTNALANNALASVGKHSMGARLGIFQTETDRLSYDMEKRFGPIVDAVLSREAIVTDTASRQSLVKETARAMTEASLKLLRNAGGDYQPDPVANRFPKWQSRKQMAGANNAVTLPSLFKRWEEHPENEGVARRTKNAYRSVFRAVAKFLDDPGANEVSISALDRYFEARMTASDKTRLSPRTARDVHKAALASVYGWAVGKRLVLSNPASEIRIKVKKPPTVRSKGATDAEARTLADAAIAIPATTPSQQAAAALRWCPLLLLYTGTRIGELTQLRREDIADIHSRLPMLRLTPEAGDIKGGDFRQVPIHPRLVDLGFLDFVEAADDGPLFYHRGSRRRKDAKTTQSELVAGNVADFARASGLHDPNLKRPLHSLRHRFMTLARRAAIEEQYVEAIAGHAPGKQNREYGDYPPEVLHREVRKLDPQIVEGRG